MKPEVERCGEEAIRLNRVKEEEEEEEEDVVISGARCQRRCRGRGCRGQGVEGGRGGR
jgi:hypothetical protein